MIHTLRSGLEWFSRSARRIRLLGLSREVGRQSGRPLIVGFFGAPSGIGMGARLLLEAFRDMGLDPAVADMTARLIPDQDRVEWRAGRVFPEDDGAGPVIVHVNAPEVPYVLSEMGRSRLEGRLRVAYWTWEFERIPASWARDLDYFHECWAPSDFAAAAIQAGAPGIPVRAIGYPLAPAVVSAASVETWRARFAPNNRTLCLHVFDARSSMDRKNPIGAIEIFRQAFAGNNEASLILKVSSWGWHLASDAELLRQISGDPRIHLVTETLTDSDMATLVAAADVYLSPHRCEGFGLMLASALLAGAEVLMTDWSGNTDFADLPGVHRIPCTLVQSADTAAVYAHNAGRWAEPDLAAAALMLQDAVALRKLDGPARVSLISTAAIDRFKIDSWMKPLWPLLGIRVRQPG